MANTILLADYQELWRERNPNAKKPDSKDASDIINLCPQEFGSGYKRWIELRDISLLIVNAEFNDNWVINTQSQEYHSQELEFGFHLSGNWHDVAAGKNFFQGIGSCKWNNNQRLEKQKIIKVDIHLETTDIFDNFINDGSHQVNSSLKKLLNNYDKACFQVNNTTPAMQMALEQIINCPFQGLTKKIFLESKCLELIALKLEQLEQVNNIPLKTKTLKSDDIERIYYAREILMKNLSNPPSLLELARQTGLNDYKLKLGFRQVFDTTAFGYLHQQRMEKARQLLLTSTMNIKEIANTVGYVNQSRFAAAFRKQFGTNPKSYKTT